jgi:aminopeptidase-like protein
MSGGAPIDRARLGRDLYQLIVDLFPLCRSITGDGVRQTLSRIQKTVPLDVHEVPTGTRVFDWTVPKEWNVRSATIRNSRGETVLDFADCNLHVLSYSIPVSRKLRLDDLKPHLHTLPEHPDWIPYRTSYYDESWGFCLSHRQLEALPDDEYEVCIDSSLDDGHLTYGEYYVRGESDDEILISCHVCHPSLCNDNLSGVAVAAHLAEHVASTPRRYSYRFLFVPATIGPITWLARNEEAVRRIRHGLVLACVGDPGQPTYKKSRRGDAEIDRAAEHVLAHASDGHAVEDFSPYGYDERQYCSPGFDLPVGCFMRTPHGRFAEYHTSADDLRFVRPESLADSFEKVLSVLDLLEHNRRYRNLEPRGEPQLGRRGLYDSVGGRRLTDDERMALLWVLNLSDGAHDLLAIAERSRLAFERIRSAAEALWAAGLLETVEEKEG